MEVPIGVNLSNMEEYGVLFQCIDHLNFHLEFVSVPQATDISGIQVAKHVDYNFIGKPCCKKTADSLFALI